MHVNSEITRRQFLKATGALVVAFGLPVTVQAQSAPAPHTSGGPLPPGQIDSWLIIGKDGRVTVMTGKVELGTGVSTSLRQIVAEELDYPFEKINWIQGDTANTVDQAPTFGSQTIKRGGSQLRQAAAEAKAVLLSLAAERLGMPIEQLAVSQGVISVQGDAKRTVSYVDLLGGQQFNREVTGKLKPKSTSTYNSVGKPVPRVDVPFKVTGTHVYMQDLRIPGMLHGRPIRPSTFGAKLVGVDESSVKDFPGLVKVVVKGNFVGVVCEREEQAIRVARDLKVTWDGPQTLPPMSELYATLRKIASNGRESAKTGDVEGALAGAAKTFNATYQWPFQLHASIGPSCGLPTSGTESNDLVWDSRSASTSPDHRAALQNLCRQYSVVFVEASGCYGHNGADDAAADAALLAQAVGKPVRVQWMRHDEHGWEPLGRRWL
jgi:CO/xanthine dehydrogenase Mo-binding subunit